MCFVCAVNFDFFEHVLMDAIYIFGAARKIVNRLHINSFCFYQENKIK